MEVIFEEQKLIFSDFLRIIFASIVEVVPVPKIRILF
jgi:hypothetical protein